MWPFFYQSPVESGPPTPGAVTIYSGGTVNPLSEGSWPVENGTLIYIGNTVTTNDAVTMTGITLPFADLDGDLDISQLEALNEILIQANSFNSVNLINDHVNVINFSHTTIPITIEIDNENLQQFDIPGAEGLSELIFTNAPNLSNLSITVTSVETLDLSPCENLQQFVIENNSFLTTIDLTDLDLLLLCAINGSLVLATLTITSLPECIVFQIFNCPLLTTFDISTIPNIQQLDIVETPITTIGTIPATLVFLNLQLTELDQSELDDILSDLVTNGEVGGQLDIRVVGGIVPSNSHANGNWEILVNAVPPVGSIELTDGNGNTTGVAVFGVDITVGLDTEGQAQSIAEFLNSLGFGWTVDQTGNQVIVTIVLDSQLPLMPSVNSATNITINDTLGSRSNVGLLQERSWDVLTN